MKRLFSAACMAATMSLALALPAAAQGMGQGGMGQGGMGQGQGMGMGKGGGMVMQQCAAEIKAHCADVQHGRGNVPACLEKNKDKLSDGCKAALEGRGPHGMGMPKAPAK